MGRLQLNKLIFLSNALKLTDYIAENEIGLPSDTRKEPTFYVANFFSVSVEKDVKASFSPVLRISQVQQKETILRVSGTFLQVT